MSRPLKSVNELLNLSPYELNECLKGLAPEAFDNITRQFITELSGDKRLVEKHLEKVKQHILMMNWVADNTRVLQLFLHLWQRDLLKPMLDKLDSAIATNFVRTMRNISEYDWSSERSGGGAPLLGDRKLRPFNRSLPHRWMHSIFARARAWHSSSDRDGLAADLRELKEFTR